MKKPSSTLPRTTKDLRADKILRSLRTARKQAVEIARQHFTSIIYMKDRKLIRERP